MEYIGGFEFEYKQMDAAGAFEGYASTFGNIDRQGDKIAPAAFTDTLEETQGKVPFLLGHNTGRIIGFGTGAEQNSKGLKVWGEFTLDSDEGRNAYATARHAHKLGTPVKLSIGYGVRENGSKRDERTGIRTLTAVDLFEYSLVAVPANPRASMTNVKTEGVSLPDLERILREVGVTRSAAKLYGAAVYQALNGQREVVPADASSELVKQFSADLGSMQLRQIMRELEQWPLHN